MSLCMCKLFLSTKLNQSIVDSSGTLGHIPWTTPDFSPDWCRQVCVRANSSHPCCPSFHLPSQRLCLLSCNQGTILEPFHTLLRRSQLKPAPAAHCYVMKCPLCFSFFPVSFSLLLHSYFLGSHPQNTTCTHILVSGSASRKTHTETYISSFNLIPLYLCTCILSHCVRMIDICYEN